MGLFDYLLGHLQNVAEDTVEFVAPEKRSIQMNRLGLRILEVTGARVYSTWAGNHYMPGPNIIYMNNMGGSTLGRFTKRMLDRDQSMEMSFYHELGHAFVSTWRIFDDPEANEIFGDFNAPSPGSLGVLRASHRRKEEGYISRYAMEHAEEDFADCFAYIVFNNMNIGSEIQDGLVKEKLRYVQHLLRKYVR